MRELLFRGQTRKKGQQVWMDGTPVDGQWVYGGIFQGTGDYSIIYGAEDEHFTGKDLGKYVVYSDTVGQYTGRNEFVITDKNFNKPLFEGDIVEVWSRRRPFGENIVLYRDNTTSKYDLQVKVRAVIYFKDGQWALDYGNAYNEAICELKGNEQSERTVDSYKWLYDFGCAESSRDWCRENWSKYKWSDIIKIGNIYDNPELLEVQNERI